MKIIGNLLWLLFGGIIVAMAWFVFGLIWCVTIIGIPVGVQCFKLARFSLWPFGKKIIYNAGPAKFLLNILWILFGGLEIALICVVLGLVYYVTIIGIPFGTQLFKMAKLALMPFGTKIA